MAAKEAASIPAPAHEATPDFTSDFPTSIDEGGELVYLWMTRKEICELLGVPPHTLYRMVRRGEVATNREGDELRYRPVDVDLDLADLEARAEVAATNPISVALNRSRYLDALVALVDGLTERLVHAEQGFARASQSRDDALAAARRTSRESTLLVRQLSAYCKSLVESNSALHDANASVRVLRQQMTDLRGELLELAGSPLSLPVRARLLAMAQRADVGER